MVEAKTQKVTLEIFRGDDDGGTMNEYTVEVQEGNSTDTQHDRGGETRI